MVGHINVIIGVAALVEEIEDLESQYRSERSAAEALERLNDKFSDRIKLLEAQRAELVEEVKGWRNSSSILHARRNNMLVNWPIKKVDLQKMFDTVDHKNAVKQCDLSKMED